MISSGRPKVSRFGRDEDRDAARLEDPRGLGDDALGIGHVLDRVHREHRGELAVGERQRPHVGHDRLALLAGQRARVDVDADGLARRQQVVAVADAAAEVEHACRAQEGRQQLVLGGVALPGGIEPTGWLTRSPVIFSFPAVGADPSRSATRDLTLGILSGR